MQGSNDRDEKTIMQGSHDTTVPPAAVAAKQAISMPIASRIDSALRQPAAPTGYPAPPAPAASSNRGLYMGLGALVLLLVIAAAGFYLPKFKQASASSAAPAASQPKPEAAMPAAQPLPVPTQAQTETPSGPPAAASATQGVKPGRALPKNALTGGMPQVTRITQRIIHGIQACCTSAGVAFFAGGLTAGMVEWELSAVRRAADVHIVAGFQTLRNARKKMRHRMAAPIAASEGLM